MSNHWRALRRRILTPSVSSTLLDVRGFHKKTPAAQELLEAVGRTFLTGYGHAAEARSPDEAEERLEEVPTQFRGFAYEGAAMAFTIRDQLPLGGGGRVTRFLTGRGAAHIYMVYIGVGWAMARLPRFRWPDLRVTDPLLRWLVLDGYGFHQAYFRTGRYVHERHQDHRFPWPPAEHSWYTSHAIDQGIGRALWFVGGTDADRVAALIGRFAESRRGDLYGGAALAATYAGGGQAEELQRFWQHAGPYRPQVAQGCAFGAEARVRAGLLVPHTETATEVFCGMTPERAADLVRQARPATPMTGEVPAYQVWRQRTANEFATLGRC
ncbi:DUF1702 family protein [Amycolatopsis anabasis]|uniref:DUF1702 family protein n=1 Tax=Amycolatopsis anabasis TaxID=1840409 RepID=UPI00131E1755|nr:DUF1702 family protein [Amycolatopsis anabasis]